MGRERWESGCYADAGLGWDHVRDRLRSYLTFYVHAVARGIYDARREEIEGLQAELEAPMSDDAQEEYDALDLLNEAAEASGDTRVWYFDGYAGGLMFGEPCPDEYNMGCESPDCRACFPESEDCDEAE